jgi:polysaccharide biosynthesis/export protein
MIDTSRRHNRPFHGPTLLLGMLLLGMLQMGNAEARETLGPGDSVRITVYQNPDLNTETRLSENGTLAMPLLGIVDIGGMTPIEAGKRIASKLEQGRFLVDPQVTVTLIEIRSRQVSILGHVARPGNYALDGGGQRLIDFLAMAGGINESGDDTVIVMSTRDGKVVRHEVNVPDMYRTGDMSGNLQLSGGDTVFVPGAEVFYVYGEVRQAGSYRLRPKTTVLDALSLGGGLTPRGTDRGIRIHRQMPDGSINLLEASLSDQILANDVVHVRESLF